MAISVAAKSAVSRPLESLRGACLVPPCRPGYSPQRAAWLPDPPVVHVRRRGALSQLQPCARKPSSSRISCPTEHRGIARPRCVHGSGRGVPCLAAGALQAQHAIAAALATCPPPGYQRLSHSRHRITRCRLGPRPQLRLLPALLRHRLAAVRAGLVLAALLAPPRPCCCSYCRCRSRRLPQRCFYAASAAGVYARKRRRAASCSSSSRRGATLGHCLAAPSDTCKHDCLQRDPQLRGRAGGAATG